MECLGETSGASKQINDGKNKILQGVPFTNHEVDLFVKKVTTRERLNQELEKVRKGESLIM